MSIQEGHIAQSYPHILTTKISSMIETEVVKGCSPNLHFQPIELEPVFQPLGRINRGDKEISPQVVLSKSFKESDMIRHTLFLNPKGTFDWIKPELLIKQLSSSQERLAFEISGNKEKIQVTILSHRIDSSLVQAAIRGQFPEFDYSIAGYDSMWDIPLRYWEMAKFNDFYPFPPYSHLLTRPIELHYSPLESLINQLMVIPDYAKGLYQIIFQPVKKHHDWHRNVEILLELEYKLTLHQDGFSSNRIPQQMPTMDLRSAAQEINNKAHCDKPFYATAFRTLLISTKGKPESFLTAINSISNIFQHGSKSLHSITEQEYLDLFSPASIRNMFFLAQTFRPGFLLNSWELTGLVHFPLSENHKRNDIPLGFKETLSPKRNPLNTGTLIGYRKSLSGNQNVYIPPNVRLRHTHVLGRTGVGKSILMESMALHDIQSGHGIAVFDPHGDLVNGILMQIPKQHINRVVYFEPGHAEWIPIWNPLVTIPGQEPARLAVDMVKAFKNIVEGWGDRLERILRNCFIGLLKRKQCSFLDVHKLLHGDQEILREILNCDLTDTERMFWKEFEKYKSDALDPPKNKLDKLLASGGISMMLSQPENRFNLSAIMEENKILLINLSSIGSESRDLLGSFMLSLFHLSALNRPHGSTHVTNPFHLYCDEAHRFITGSIEDIIVETRKFGVSLTLANQYLSQFPKEKRDALSNAGTTILFNIDSKDAQYELRNLRDLVSVDDIISLEIGEAIAKIDTEIIRFNSVWNKNPAENWKDDILTHSFQNYYKQKHLLTFNTHSATYQVHQRNPMEENERKQGDGHEFQFRGL